MVDTAPITQARDAFYKTLRANSAKRYKTFDPLSVRALFNLIQTFAMGEAQLSGRVQSAGITLPGLNVLSVLREHGPEGCPLNTISRLLLVSRANITGLVDSLVRKRFVIREDHAHDRRVILAKITKAGEAWLDSYLPGHHTQIQKMFSGLTKDEKEELNRLLEKLQQTSCSHPRENR